MGIRRYSRRTRSTRSSRGSTPRSRARAQARHRARLVVRRDRRAALGAARVPARIARLVLVCATPRFVAAADWAPAMASATLARFGDELRVAYRPTLQRFLTLQVQGSAEGRATLAALRSALFARGEPSPRGARVRARRAAGDRPARRRAARSRAPALVVTGSRDALTPPAAGAWLAGALPQRAPTSTSRTPRTRRSCRIAPQFDAAVTEFLDAV